MTAGTIFSIALLATLVINGVVGAVLSYKHNGWRKPTQWYDWYSRNHGAF